MKKIIARHYESKEYIYPIAINKIHVKLEVISGKVNNVKIKFWKRFAEDKIASVTMENFSYDSNSPYFEAVIEIHEQSRYLHYYFVLETDNSNLYLSRDGLNSQIPTRFFEFQYVNKSDVIETPEWIKGRIGYQIFVDRFNRVYVDEKGMDLLDWDSEPTRENIFGGNLRGVTAKLDYLKNLGISLIVFMPIFSATSNHKYDTLDYFKIDSNYGSNTDFKELVDKAHSLDIKIVLDGVFNHMGYYSKEFQDALMNGKNSKYYSWFNFNSEDLSNYLAVGDYKWMPKLNYESEDLCDHVIKIGKYWIENYNIDGWRLDVFDEVEERFRNRFSSEIKRGNKETFLISETWHDGYELLASHQVHSVMNYLLRNDIIDYFIDQNISSSDFINKLNWLKFRYPKPLQSAMYNLLGSHDTIRIATRSKNNPHRLMLAYAFLFFSAGLPVIYYGDEVGMTGEVDPGCRKSMEWDKVGNDFYREIKKLIEIRNNNETIKFGDIKYLRINDLIGFVRNYKNKKILILFNTLDIDKEVSLEEFQVDNKHLVEKHSYSIIEI